MSECVFDSPGTYFRQRTIKDHDGSCTVVFGPFEVVSLNTPVQFDFIAIITDQLGANKEEDGANTDKPV
ncbi:hypothetical protein DPMN_042955 [Dreissena polymorpha]|uniref:Uncharacterized protein n=1 Tax=Dreissena polymorpha TaxID=45954 RepID=A0A9D4D1G2_DREPO|nr:hypothetical protein DPMN_042955 [Dreissena polymorpha]